MGYEKKSPSIKLLIGRELFDKLVGLLETNMNLEIEDEKFSKIAEKLKNKLLKYSIPKIENDMEYVDIRFFPSEASDVIWQLLAVIKTNVDKDYYSTLIDNRKQLKNI